VQNFVKIGQSLLKYHNFSDFQHGGCRHLGFSKTGNFNGLSPVGGPICIIVQNFIKIHQTVA